MSLELDFAVAAVRKAGDVIGRYFRGAFEVAEKGVGNPVTTADLEADTLLRETFAREFPRDGWLSEETADSPERLGCRRVWVVDPLDGTREFVQGLPEFAISLALVVDGVPQLAVVYNPARDEIFTAERGAGARHRGESVEVPTRESIHGARLLVSRSEATARVLDELGTWARLETVGSIAYKLARLAAGAGDATVSVWPKSEWDVCAGALLVEEAGGCVTDLAGNPLAFNRPAPRIRGILAANPALHARVLEWLRSSSSIPVP